jgi:hypothetical protein
MTLHFCEGNTDVAGSEDLRGSEHCFESDSDAGVRVLRAHLKRNEHPNEANARHKSIE